MVDKQTNQYIEMLNRIRTGKLCQYCNGEGRGGKINHDKHCPVILGFCSHPDCNEPEYRIDGYCSIYCRDTHELEIAIDELLDVGKRLFNAIKFERGQNDAMKKWLEIKQKYGEK